MQINVTDFDKSEPAALAKVVERVQQHQHVSLVTIHCAYRRASRPEGWLEYIAVIEYDSGGKLILGCIERHEGAEMEFHS